MGDGMKGFLRSMLVVAVVVLERTLKMNGPDHGAGSPVQRLREAFLNISKFYISVFGYSSPLRRYR